MNEEELLERLMNELHNDTAIADGYQWMKNPEDPTQAFVIVDAGEGGDIFIISIQRGKIELT